MAINAAYNTTIEFEVYSEVQIPLTATFEADVKPYPIINGNDEILATLTTAAGTIEIVSSEANANPDYSEAFVSVIALTFLGADSQGWDGDIVTDLARTDVSPAEYMGFMLIVPVNPTITRVA